MRHREVGEWLADAVGEWLAGATRREEVSERGRAPAASTRQWGRAVGFGGLEKMISRGRGREPEKERWASLGAVARLGRRHAGRQAPQTEAEAAGA
jgi:hypothetical protein